MILRVKQDESNCPSEERKKTLLSTSWVVCFAQLKTIELNRETKKKHIRFKSIQQANIGALHSTVREKKKPRENSQELPQIVT